MTEGVTDFILDTRPFPAYYDLWTRNILTAEELKYFTIPVFSQSNLDESSNVELGMLEEESTTSITEAPRYSQTEALSGYLKSEERSAIPSPETVFNVTSTGFSRETYEQQQDTRSVTEVVPLENFYRLLEEESEFLDNLQMETFEQIIQPNVPSAENQWQSDNYMYSSETPFTTNTSSIMTTPGNNWRSYNYTQSTETSISSSLNDALVCSNQQSEIEELSGYSNSQASYALLPSETFIRYVLPSFSTNTLSNTTISNNQHYGNPLDMNSLSGEFIPSMSDVTVLSEAIYQNSTAVCTYEPTVTTRPNTSQSSFTQTVSERVHPSETSFPTATSSNAIVSPHQMYYFTLDMSLRPSEFVHSVSAVTVLSNEKFTAMSRDESTMTTLPLPCHTSFPLSVVINSGKNPYVCNAASNVSRHFSSHTRERSYACEICNKTFGHRGQLNRHTKIHTGEKPYACKRCDKMFIEKSALDVHTRFHTGERPYVCEICNKKFVKNAYLKRHFRIHTREKPI